MGSRDDAPDFGHVTPSMALFLNIFQARAIDPPIRSGLAALRNLAPASAPHWPEVPADLGRTRLPGLE